MLERNHIETLFYTKIHCPLGLVTLSFVLKVSYVQNLQHA